MKTISKGFTMIEMVIIIILIGIIGSLAADMLFQGAGVYVEETNRQGFVSESRAAFWRLMREVQGQSSPDDFVLSDQKNVFLKNGKNEQLDFQTNQSGYFNLRFGSSNYNTLSNSLAFSQSVGFNYLNKTYEIINPSSGGLTFDQAKTIWLTKLELTFINDKDTLELLSYVYPHNFRFGKKMSYHN